MKAFGVLCGTLFVWLVFVQVSTEVSEINENEPEDIEEKQAKIVKILPKRENELRLNPEVKEMERLEQIKVEHKEKLKRWELELQMTFQNRLQEIREFEEKNLQKSLINIFIRNSHCKSDQVLNQRKNRCVNKVPI